MTKPPGVCPWCGAEIEQYYGPIGTKKNIWDFDYKCGSKVANMLGDLIEEPSQECWSRRLAAAIKRAEAAEQRIKELEAENTNRSFDPSNGGLWIQ